MDNKDIINKIIYEWGQIGAKNLAIDILIVCRELEYQNLSEKSELKDELKKQEMLQLYIVGDFVKYVRVNKTNNHLFTLDKKYEIVFSRVKKNWNNIYCVEYTILDDFGKKKTYNNIRVNSFDLVKS